MKVRNLVSLACAPALAATLACATLPPAAPTASAIGGHLLIVGGGPIPPEIIRRFVDLAGGPAKARIVVFPMASGDSDAGIEMTADLNKLGARPSGSSSTHRPIRKRCEAARRRHRHLVRRRRQVKLTRPSPARKVEASCTSSWRAAPSSVGRRPARPDDDAHAHRRGEARRRRRRRDKSPLAAYMTVPRRRRDGAGLGFLSGAIVISTSFAAGAQPSPERRPRAPNSWASDRRIDRRRVGPDGKWKVLARAPR